MLRKELPLDARTVGAAAALLITFLACRVSSGSPGAGAAPNGASGSRVWKTAEGTQVMVIGRGDVEGRVFQSPDFQREIVVLQKGLGAWMLDLKAKQVSALPLNFVTPLPDGLALADGATTGPPAHFTQSGADIDFQAGPFAVHVTPEPPLLGEVTLAQILDHKKIYGVAAKAYEPDKAAIATLQKLSQPIDIVVFFGTWCPSCRKWLPGFIKTLEVLNSPQIHVTWYAIDAGYTTPKEPIWKYNAHITPTVIVLSQGKEIGRIKGRPYLTMEGDLADIVKDLK